MESWDEEGAFLHYRCFLTVVRIKSHKYQSIGKDVEQLEFSYTAGGNINSYKHLGNSLVEPTEVIYTHVL